MKVGAGKLLVCSCDLQAQQNYPEARQLFYSLLRYMESEAFNPGQALETDLSFGGWIFRVPLDLDQAAILHRRQHPAGAVAVAWAYGPDDPTAHYRPR